jgi:hypothetical protein
VYLIGVFLIWPRISQSMHLIDVHVINMHLIDAHLTEYVSHKRVSHIVHLLSLALPTPRATPAQ